LFARYARRLHAFFVRSVGQTAAEDLLQITFLKLHRARQDYVASMPFRAWLFTIAARTRADELRRHYRSRVDTHVDTEALVDRSGLDIEDRVLTHQVRRAIESLPEGQRLAVWLHRFEGLSFAEIAAVLSEVEGKPVKEGAARIRAFRAYETLRAQLADVTDAERT
jgi:RNA polymerase sigma-70 factor (ECF subfamily)